MFYTIYYCFTTTCELCVIYGFVLVGLGEQVFNGFVVAWIVCKIQLLVLKKPADHSVLMLLTILLAKSLYNLPDYDILAFI